MATASVVVLARAPRPGACKTRLEPVLGPEGCAELQRVLVVRTVRWAAAAGEAFLAHDPPDARDDLARLAPGAALFAQRGEGLGERMVHAMDAVARERPGAPLVVVGTDLPTLRPAHAAAALDDLRTGCDVSIGPTTDGGLYLIALRKPLPELLALPPAAWGGPKVARLVLERVVQAGLDVGMLRAERDLDDPQDARAFLADPCTPADVLQALHAP